MVPVLIDPLTDPRWPVLLAARGGGLFHSAPWLASLADTYGLRPQAVLLTDEAGCPQAGIPFCVVDDLLGERIVSLPFSDHCEPLVGSDAQWSAALAVLASAGLPVAFRWLDQDRQSADGRWTTTKRARWQGLAIGPDVEALWDRMAPPARRAVRKAARAGVEVRGADDGSVLPAFTRLHVSLRKRKYRLLAQPHEFFAALRRRFAAIDGWFPLAAWYGGRIVAVTIYLRWGDTLYYKFNASDFDALAERPNDALLWEGIRLAQRLGCRQLDLGASDDDQPGLIRFKRHYGADEREIRFVRYEPPGCFAPRSNERRATETRALLARLTDLFTDPAVPDEITACAGGVLYRLFA